MQKQYLILGIILCIQCHFEGKILGLLRKCLLAFYSGFVSRLNSLGKPLFNLRKSISIVIMFDMFLLSFLSFVYHYLGMFDTSVHLFRPYRLFNCEVNVLLHSSSKVDHRLLDYSFSSWRWDICSHYQNVPL